MVTLSLEVLYMLLLTSPQVRTQMSTGTSSFFLTSFFLTRKRPRVKCHEHKNILFFQVKEEFLREGGASILEIIQYNDEGEIRQKASYLVDQLLLTQQQHTI